MRKLLLISSICFSINLCSCQNVIDEDKIEESLKFNHQSPNILQLQIPGEYLGKVENTSSSQVRNIFYIDTINNALLTVLYFNDSANYLKVYHFLGNKLVKTVGENFNKTPSNRLEDLFYYSEADNNVVPSSMEDSQKYRLLHKAKLYLKILDEYKSNREAFLKPLDN